MALKLTIKEVEFGVGDRIRVVQKIKDSGGDAGKSREAIFEGMVLAIRGRDPSKSFVVRRVAEGNIGVERIFPANLPSIDRISVIKTGTPGIRRAKLYYTRTKAPTEIEMIYKRANIKLNPPKVKKVKRAKIKSVSKKSIAKKARKSS